MDKFLFDQINAFASNWKVDYPGQRFGQAFCNHFNIADSELFYCNDQDRSWEIIIRKYLKEE